MPRYRHPVPDVPTLGIIRRSTPWVWLYCNECTHRAPAALAPFLIRWGARRDSNL